MSLADRITGTVRRWHWRDWSVVVKLVAVLAVPTVVALVLGVLRVTDEAGEAETFLRADRLIAVQQQVSGLLTELQAERDLVTADVAGGRAGDRGALQRQYAAVTGAMAATRRSVQALAGTEEEVVAAFREAAGRLDGLAELRRRTEAANVSPFELILGYDGVTGALIDLDGRLAVEIGQVGGLGGLPSGLHDLVIVQEQVARQHAVLAGAIPRNRLEPAEANALRDGDVRLDVALVDFRTALTPEQQRAYHEAVSGPDVETRLDLKELALARTTAGRPLGILLSDWNARSAATVELVRQAVDELRQQLSATSARLQEAARDASSVNAVILFIALTAGVLIGIFVTRSLLTPLRTLRRTALEVAERRLPEAVRGMRERGGRPDVSIQPVPVTTREELGQVARAFDAVHSQAVRLAAEQSVLRANVSNMFVNLARRSQGLVERQLRLIEELESNEQDPDVLANLFQLDHLATRMRRNSENLLVLSGTELARRAGRPVPLVDVLRAAVSEVEQYQRVDLSPPPSVLLSGRVGSDLVHVMAELLDNATSFSAPDTRVVIRTRLGPDGQLTVEIVDEGVGMSVQEIEEANARLAAPPAVDVSVSRRMGLFVVGRLANRNDITVRLHATPGRPGLTASVTVPATAARPETGEAVDPTAPSLGGAVPLQAPAPASPNGSGKPNSLGDRVRDGSAPSDPTRADETAAGLPRRRPATPPPAPEPAPPAPIPRADRSPASGLFTPTTAADGSHPAKPSPPADPAPPSPPDVDPTPIATAVQFSTLALREKTPIFEEIASAWFAENKPVPGRRPGHAEPQPAGRSSDGAPAERGEDAPESAAPADLTWGSADVGWQAAETLARPESSGLTAAGLPRRRPQAHLVPGAAGPGPSGADGSSLARDAESVRGRLSSYQQGVREGRHRSALPPDEADRQTGVPS